MLGVWQLPKRAKLIKSVNLINEHVGDAPKKVGRDDSSVDEMVIYVPVYQAK